MAQQKLKTEKLSDYPTWVRAIWITARGTPLEFDNRPYLVEIYNDQHPDIVITKSAQMGLSERMISEAVWFCDQMGGNVLYTFPAQTQLEDFVQARLDPVIAMSDYLKGRCEDDQKSVLKIGLKRIGKGYIYLRGSQNEKQIITIDADMIILDERDRFIPENVPFIDKRMLASKIRWRREISTPTLPGAAIHLAYLKSDQRIWEIECPKCHLWQELDFFKNIDFEKKIAVCLECKTKLNRTSKGRWRALKPGVYTHGYRVNGLYNPMRNISAVITEYNLAQTQGFSALQQFFNQVLGLPYEVSGQSVRAEELDACKVDYMMPYEATNMCYAGADVGVKWIHCVVVQKESSGKYRVVWAGRVRNFDGPTDSLEQIMKFYNIKKMVVDKKPETKKLQELVEKYPGRVYAATYSNSPFTVTEYYKFDDILYEVKLDRTISLDYIVSDIQNKVIELPSNIESVEDFFDELRASTRITEKNPRTGIEVPRWVEKGADHYFHALNYARIAQIRDTSGKALLDYYVKPEKGVTASFIDWLRINAQRIDI